MPLHKTNTITTSPMAYSYGPVSSSLWDPAQTAYNGCVWSYATNAWVPYGGVSPTLKKPRSKSLTSYYSSYGSYSASYASSYSASVRRERKTASSPRKNAVPEKKTSRSSRGRSMERSTRSRSRGNREPKRITRERSAESRSRVRGIKLTPAPRQRRLTRAVSTSRERSSKKCSSREQSSTTCRNWADRFAEDDAKKKSWNRPEETRYQWSSWTWCTSAKRRANKKRGGWRVQAKKTAWLQKTPQDASITPRPSVMAASLDDVVDDVVDEKRRHRSRSNSSDSSV